MPTEILAWSVVLGATAAGFVSAVRGLPWVQRAIMDRRKPWACDVCMGFWTTGAVTVGLAYVLNDIWALLWAGPAYSVALWILRKLGEPQLPPLPPLREE
ncbi:MAG: hypothetical protein ACE5F6_00335 [Anaerolineae bacterium]